MKELLKFITCGSVDDGKSTLIGHMLYDARLLFSDQEESLRRDSKTGSRGGEVDYALLLDGLTAEREQGITIDVAYRFFTTEKRSFIVADTPGHEEYTRNMAVGASFADLAVILVDASSGILIQTRRHARICAMMGIRHFVFALNKMDLVGYDQDAFRRIREQLDALAEELQLMDVKVIPVSATEGDNVTEPSPRMDWYKGETLLSWMEQVDIEHREEEGFLLPVQRVCRPDSSFRGYAGQIESGSIRLGETVTVLPGNQQAAVSRIFRTDEEVREASAGMPVTVCLDREIDVSRGSVLAKGTDLSVTGMFAARILWMDEEKLVEGREYLLKIGTQRASATVIRIKCRVDVNTGDLLPARDIGQNEIAQCDLAVSRSVVFDRFDRHHCMGEFILIDRLTHMTCACGTVLHPLRRAENLVWQELDITRDIRAEALHQRPKTIWFTGLSGAGKSTLANAVEKELVKQGKHTMLLDGDNIRMGINNNLGFTEKDRIENIRRIGEVAKLMNDAGLITLAALISPYRSDRRRVRRIIGEEDFIEVYVSTPLEECRRRDPKGLYEKALRGDIPNFTGVGSPYEPPEHPQIVIDTSEYSPEEALEKLMEELKKYL